ncbi:ABC transporter ATP-binding protein [Acetobacterium malicum]|uniref:ABC transporter ATP-binding protein n=1 Tax=Acetobacterium malicum TaxID=52692 RepID=UPI0035932A75
MIALKTENLKVGYGKKVVVDAVDISGFRGQVLCLLGPNGAGKSTILRTLSGLLDPLDGVVYVNQEKLLDKKKKDLAKELSVVLTTKFSAGMMKVYDVVSMGRYPYTSRLGKLTGHDHQLIQEALITVNADYLATRNFEELSDGERQKVMVARALVQEPEVMILDEPTSHLDIRHQLELIDILKNLSKEKNITIILSLHEIDLALKSCETVLLVRDNRIVGYGAPEDMVNEETISQLYGIKNAGYNNLLGSIEIANSGDPTVFVVAGNGTGIPIYRLLSKHNIGAMTGIIHENDVDYEVARTMGLTIKSAFAFEEIDDVSFLGAKKMIDRIDTVIDSGFPVRKMNQKNLELIRYAISKGKKVISFRPEEERQHYFGGQEKQMLSCHQSCDFFKHLETTAMPVEKLGSIL